MTEPIHVVWGLLRTVSDRCEELTWSLPGEIGPQKPRDWNTLNARLEYRIFGIFLLSHAMTHFQHDLDARDRAIYFCIDALADEFDEVDLEGGDFEAFVMSRFEKYSKIDNNNESQSWSGWLQYYLASSPATPVALKPPVIIGDFMEQSGLKLHLINCIDNLYMSAFYMHIAKICQKHCDIFAMSISELEACLRAPAKEDNPHKTSKKTGILRRIFRQRSE